MTRQLIIVDDDPSVRRSLTRWAKVSGYEVTAFASGCEFLACDIDMAGCCLILDVGLPDVDGGEVKRRLIARGRDLPTIFITGLNDDEVAIALFGVGAPQVLRKPFDTASLEAAIEALG